MLSLCPHRVVNQYLELFKNESKGFVKMTHDAGGVASPNPVSPGKEIEVCEMILLMTVRHLPLGEN